MASYYRVKPGEWFAPARSNHKLMCCDCGLVHTMNMRLVKDGRRGKKIVVQFFRDNRATANARRRKRRLKV